MAEKIKEKEEINPKRGKSFSLEAYKSSFPDNTQDPDDETLYDWHNSRYENLEGKYNSLSGANDRLNKLVMEDPNLGVLLSKIAGDKPRSLPYAIAETYGKDFFENSEDFEEGYQEFLKEEKRRKDDSELANKNFSDITIPRLKQFASDNQLSDDEVTSIFEGLKTLAESFLMGDISQDLISLVHKGLNYEKDVQEAVDTGYIEGKNEKVEAEIKKNSSIPSLGNGGKISATEKQKRGVKTRAHFPI